MTIDPILARLAELRRRIRLLLFVDAGINFALIASGMVVGSFLLDWLFELPFGMRLVMLLLMAGVMIHGARRFFLQPAAVRLPDESLALVVQRKHPEFGDELISALQFHDALSRGDSSESPELMRDAVAAAVERFGSTRFVDVATSAPLRRPIVAALMVVAALSTYATMFPDHLSIWLDRCIFLSSRPWPPDTSLEVSIANVDKFRVENKSAEETVIWVPENSVLRVDVQAVGKIPASVQIKKFTHPRSENPDPITIDMPVRPGTNEFEYKFGRVVSSFEFHVIGGDDDDELPHFTIMVRAAPRVNSLVVDFDYPQYINDTGEPDKKGLKEYNVIGPEGSRVTMHFHTSGSLESFDVVLDEKAERSFPLIPRVDSPADYDWSFVLDEDHLYTYKLVGQNGAPSREEPSFNISVQPDIAPQIGITLPETTSLDVTAQATVILAFQVSDDYRVGDVAFRWDTQREGAFANRVPLVGDDRKERSQARDVFAVHTIEAKDFTAVEESSLRPLRPGDALHLRLEASDTRSTEKHPDPNLSVYPTLITLNVREGSEIARELTRTQLRLKDQVRRVEELARTQFEQLETIKSTLIGEEGAIKAVDGEIQTLIAAQDLVTSSLSESARGYVRVFDGYLFNRLEPSAFTESLIADFSRRHRADDGSHYEILCAVLPEARPRIDDSEVMGKLARIMDLLIEVADRQSPASAAALKSVLDQKAADDRRRAVEASLDAAKRLHENLLLLCDKMEEWEDFQDVVQNLQDIIEAQKGLADRIKNMSPK